MEQIPLTQLYHMHMYSRRWRRVLGHDLVLLELVEQAQGRFASVQINTKNPFFISQHLTVLHSFFLGQPPSLESQTTFLKVHVAINLLLLKPCQLGEPSVFLNLVLPHEREPIDEEVMHLRCILTRCCRCRRRGTLLVSLFSCAPPNWPLTPPS